jgi:hypothetical protein
MNKVLSIDEFDALEQISRLGRSGKPSICVNRNAKRLCGIKFASYRKDGQLELTDEGSAVYQTLYRRIAAGAAAAGCQADTGSVCVFEQEKFYHLQRGKRSGQPARSGVSG